MNKSTPIFQLKIALTDIRPPIWRRVLMPADVKLPKLHRYFQAIMGWENYHLHSFDVGDTVYGEPDPDPLFDDGFIVSERRIRLMDLVNEEKTSFIYMYDFGDDWRHKVTLEKILPVAPDAEYPLCIKGRRACPPEDCGGAWGYENLLDALTDPEHEDHEELLEWVGGAFDSEGFDLNAINQALRKVR